MLSVAKDSLEASKKQDYPELKNIILRDHNINKYSDFCRRILNKRNISENKNAPLYCIVEQLEKIGDIYRDLCAYVSENKLKLEKSSLDIFEKINELLLEFYELFYKFDFERLEQFGNKKEEIKILFNKSRTNDQINFLLNNILLTTADLNGALMTYKI